jgi:putative ABC transport system permease protein
MERIMGTMTQDLKYGIRMLLKNPGFTAVAVLTLALGIGANTAIFSVVDGVLLRPLPFPEPERIFAVHQALPEKGIPKTGASYPNYLDWKQQSHSFEKLAAMRSTSMALSGEGDATYIPAGAVTGDYFGVFQEKPLFGRTLQASDDSPAADAVAVMSERLWRSRFGADPKILGRTISLDQHSFAVVGIVPGNFRPPAPDPNAEVWVPLAQNDVFAQMRGRRGGHYLEIIGRLKPGVARGQAQSEMDSIEEGLEKQFPDDNKGWVAKLVPLQEDLVGDFRTELLVLLGAVGLVFLIACANVAGLQLARAAARGREVAIRVALGAGRSRLIRQFLTECVLLGIVGGIAGIVLAYATVQGLISWIPSDVPRMNEIQVDGRVLGFGLALSLLSGIVFGLAPGWHVAGDRFSNALKEGTRSGGEDGRRRVVRSAIVVTEMGLAVVLLVGAGLLIRSFERLQKVNAGFNASHLLTAQIGLPRAQYSKPEQWAAFESQLLERMEATPGVDEATAALPLPLVGGYLNLAFQIEGEPPRSKSESPATNYVAIGSNYFHAMQIPLLRGREITAADQASAPKVCVISETMARRFFPNENPIGKRVVIGFPEGVPREVVGIVGGVKDVGLADNESTQVYIPFSQSPFWAVTLAVRAHGDASQLSAAVREQVRAIDPALPIAEIKPMTDVIAESISQPRFRTTLLGLFGVTALFLAAIGIYGVISYNTAQRTREIGVRVALGAQRHDVLRLILRQGVLLGGAGVILGLAGAAALTNFLASLVFGISTSDPTTYLAVTVLLFSVALLACYVPARRAMRVDPMIALRYE